MGSFSFLVCVTQSAAAAENNGCISEEGEDSLTESPGYETEHSDCEAPVMLELWGIGITPSVPSLLGPLWLWVVATDRVLSMGPIYWSNKTNVRNPAKRNC